MRWSEPWTIEGRALVANKLLAGFCAASGNVSGRSTRSLGIICGGVIFANIALTK
jgi:hypothetical protein